MNRLVEFFAVTFRKSRVVDAVIGAIVRYCDAMRINKQLITLSG